MRQIFGGAFLAVAGIAVFIEAGMRRPFSCPEWAKCHVLGQPTPLSWSTYDLLLVGAWALVILGGLLIVMGLIKYGVGLVRRSQASPVEDRTATETDGSVIALASRRTDRRGTS